jgi:hypothetical protein
LNLNKDAESQKSDRLKGRKSVGTVKKNISEGAMKNIKDSVHQNYNIDLNKKDVDLVDLRESVHTSRLE